MKKKVNNCNYGESKNIKACKNNALIFLDEKLVKNGIDDAIQFNFYAYGDQISISQGTISTFDIYVDEFMNKHKDFMNKINPEYDLLVSKNIDEFMVDCHYSDKSRLVIGNLNSAVRKNLLDALFAVLNNGIFKSLDNIIDNDIERVQLYNASETLYKKINELFVFDTIMTNNYYNENDKSLGIAKVLNKLDNLFIKISSFLYDFFRIYVYKNINEYNDIEWQIIQDQLVKDMKQFRLLCYYIASNQIVKYFDVVDAMMEEKEIIPDNNSRSKYGRTNYNSF